MLNSSQSEKTLTVSRSKIAILALAALGVMGAAVANADPISYTRVVFFQSDLNFTAGVATNTAGSGQIWVQAFNAHDPGETITLQLLKDGNVIPNGISPSSFTDTGQTTYGFPGSTPLPVTFFYAGSGLQIRAIPSGGGASGISASFTVNPGSPARLVVLGPGEELNPGKDPAVFTGKTGTFLPQEPNQAFPITVVLTDNWFNPVTDSHNVSFASGDLIDVPAPSLLQAGLGAFNVVMRGSKIERTITVSDTTDPSVAAGTLEVNTAGPPAEEVFPFPSPFNPAAGQRMTFRFRLTSPAGVTLTVVDPYGEKVWESGVSGQSGFNDVTWDGHNGVGTRVAAGVYYVLLEKDGAVQSKKRIGVVK